MSDGYEERQETRVRIEQERREDLEDRIHIDDVDEGEPERVDSLKFTQSIPISCPARIVQPTASCFQAFRLHPPLSNAGSARHSRV